MIPLVRRRATSAVPVAFKQPKLGKKSELLASLFYQAIDGKITWDSAQWKPAKSALKRDSHGKCAYCEAPTSVVAHGDVEHFRPKSIYWWLAFCYDNYLYSCQICNQTYKSDNFPVNAARLAGPAMPATKPGNAQQLAALHFLLTHDPTSTNDADLRLHWDAEAGDLVNPYLEDPSLLFAYEIDVANEEVWIRSKGGARADRALAASETYLGLNREELRRERYVHLSQLIMLRKLLSYVLPDAAREEGLGEVRRMQRAQEPYAGMRRYFAAEWGLPT